MRLCKHGKRVLLLKYSFKPIPWHRNQGFQDQQEWQLRLLWFQQRSLPWEYHPTYTNKRVNDIIRDWSIRRKCINSTCYTRAPIRKMKQGSTWLFHIQQSLPIRPRFPQMNHGQRTHLAKHLCCLQSNIACQQFPSLRFSPTCHSKNSL